MSMCLRSVHSLRSFGRHSLRFISSYCRPSPLRFVTSSRRRCVHFSHLSTARKSYSIQSVKKCLPFVPFLAETCSIQRSLPAGEPVSSVPLHPSNFFPSFSRHPCLAVPARPPLKTKEATEISVVELKMFVVAFDQSEFVLRLTYFDLYIS